MTKTPKKSILANFASYDGAAAQVARDKESSWDNTQSAPVPRVGAGVIGATQRSLTDLREERDRLQFLVDSGGSRKIDPSIIDPSPFSDRMPEDDGSSFETFKKQVAEEGQKVPIEVRPHPTVEGRYQIVYGHRRWRAAKELEIQIRAVVVQMSDGEAAVAQGIENAARQDLTWIERATFIGSMDQAGIKSRDIRAALGIDDPELARHRSVLRSIPLDVIKAIGRAPKAGRPRWVELAELISTLDDGVSRIRQTLSADKVSTSDERLRIALSALKEASKAPSRIEHWGQEPEAIGSAQFGKGSVKLTASRQHQAEFEAFMRSELPDLARRFLDWKAKK